MSLTPCHSRTDNVHDNNIRSQPPPGFSASNVCSDSLTASPVNGTFRNGYGSVTVADSSSKTSKRFLNPSDLTVRDDFDAVDRSGRTKSFTNLAAALGEGLAVSIDHSVFEDQKHKVLNHSNSNLTSNLIPSYARNQGDDISCSFPIVRPLDNYARQSRHIASRLIGSSSSSHVVGSELRFSSLPASDSPSATNGPTESESISGRDPFFSQLETSKMLDNLSSGLDTLSLGGFLSSYGRGGVGTTVVEPGSTAPTPVLLSHSDVKDWTGGRDTNRSMSIVSRLEESISDRTSAPLTTSYDSSSSLRFQVATSMQPRAVESKVINGVHLHSSNDPFFHHAPSQSSNYPNDMSSAGSDLKYLAMDNRIHSSLSTNDIAQNEIERKSSAELIPFIWSPPPNSNPSSQSTSTFMNDSSHDYKPASRALAIVGARLLNLADVKLVCEAFGSLSYFRTEFCKDRGVIFVAYHDLRSAGYAAVELKGNLEKLSQTRSGLKDFFRTKLEVFFCVSLNSSSLVDESMLLLSNLPAGLDEKKFLGMMTSYGATRSIYFHSDRVDTEGREVVSCTVEFHDVQDASQALLEIESSMPWGPITICHRSRTVNERKLGQELLALTGRWRHGERQNLSVISSRSTSTVPSTISASTPSDPSFRGYDASMREVTTTPGLSSSDSSQKLQSTSNSPNSSNTPTICQQNLNPVQNQVTTQLMLSPNGQYSYIMIHPHDHTTVAPSAYSQFNVIPHHMCSQQYVTGLPMPSAYMASVPAEFNGYHHDAHQFWVQPSHPQIINPPTQTGAIYHPVQPAPGGILLANHSISDGLPGAPGIPYYTTINPTGSQHVSATPMCLPPMVNRPQQNQKMNQRQSSLSAQSASSSEDDHLLLDIKAVIDGRDDRSSLMVRNIPNKYTQSMLLSEFSEYGHGPTKIDFFYLPIDFKNKCNRGYAFINFVDYRDIISFHECYHGKSWKVFNSDKKCDITYARIQGKAAMMKRFQNSVLMEKDAEYRPLVFVSHGVRKGQREEFSSVS